jgi:hypothetical protein
MVFKDEEVFMKAYRAGIRALIPRLSLAQRLAVFASSQVMAGLTPEQLLAGLAPGQRIAGLTPEQLEELKSLLL